MRIVSFVSLVAGLASTGLGAVRTLGTHSPAKQASTAASTPVTSAATSASPSASLVPAPASFTRCSNDVFGYSLRYPAGWFAPSATYEQACASFDPAPISRAQLLRASRAGHMPRATIRIYPYGMPYDRAVIAIHNRSDVDANDTIDLQVGNTSGERINAKVRPSNGPPTRLFLYLFDVRGKAFVADAYEPYSKDFGETMRVLDRMMRSLRAR